MSSKKSKGYGLGDKLPNGAIIEDMLNRPGDVLPFGYCDPKSDGKLIWTCNYGIEGTEIVSVFSMKDEGRDVKYLADMEEAKYMRDELIKSGWSLLKLPQVNITFSGEGKK
jgi:hypothetical protein